MIHSTKEIDLARTCLRKWAAKYLHRCPDPKHANAQDGIDLHEVLRAMCAQGPSANVHPESKIGRWARALYPLTPPGVLCELEQQFEIFGRTASFRIDFTLPGFDGFGDWKSCAGPKWALAGPDASAEAQQAGLAGDLQANLEAFGFCTVFGRTEVPIRWLYVDKKTDRAWHVDALMTRAGTEAWLRENALPWMLVIERMRALHAAGQTPPLAAIPHAPIACDGVGRMCAFLGHCKMQQSPVQLTQIRQWAAQQEDQK